MAKKVVRKAKRKGYQEGGLVALNEAFDRSAQDSESTNRYTAAVDAMDSAAYNEMTAKQQAAYRDALERMGRQPGRTSTTRSLETGRASYPGFAKGGKVNKVAKATAKRKR